MNDFSIVMFFVGVSFFIIGIISLIVSSFMKDSKKSQTVSLIILLIGGLLAIGGFTLCTSTMNISIH